MIIRVGRAVPTLFYFKKWEISMKYRLVGIDMDNTLLNDSKEITDLNKESIRKALNQGCKIVLCSGRFHKEMIDYADILGIKGSNQYLITNGGAVIENANGQKIIQTTLSNNDCEKISSWLSQNNISYQLVEINGQEFSFNNWLNFQNNNRGLGIAKVLLEDDKSGLDNISKMIHQVFDENYYVVRPADEFLEILPKGVNKGIAIEKLAKKLNVDMQQVLTIVDMDNDIPMIEVAGKGIAMSNAVDIVKQVADDITLDNNNSGVGVAISKFVLNEDINK